MRGFEAYELAISNNTLSERLDYAERFTVLGRCAAGVAQEMRNQLVVLPLVKLIEEKFQDHAELVELARVVRRTNERLEELIDEIKAFVRREDEGCKKIHVNLGRLVREAVSLAGMHDDIPKQALKLVVDAEPVVLCHNAKIQQVLFNLIKNAADASRSQDKPLIEITVGHENGEALICPRQRVRHRTRTPGENLGALLLYRAGRRHRPGPRHVPQDRLGSSRGNLL